MNWPPQAPVAPPETLVAGGGRRLPMLRTLYEDSTVQVLPPTDDTGAEVTVSAVAPIRVTNDTGTPEQPADNHVSDEKTCGGPLQATSGPVDGSGIRFEWASTAGSHTSLMPDRQEAPAGGGEAVAGALPGTIDFTVSEVHPGHFVRTGWVTCVDAPPGAKETGRIGEWIAFQHILGASKDSDLPGLHAGPPRDVDWKNRDGETGAPYDISYVVPEADGSETTYYAEVKTTSADAKAIFEISTRELVFAQKHPRTYVILRLFEVPPDGPVPGQQLKIVVLARPWEALDSKAAQLYLRLLD